MTDHRRRPTPRAPRPATGAPPRFGSGGPRLSRRSFLVAVGAAGLTAACTTPERTYDLGQSSRLTVLNWPDYIDADDNGDVDYGGGTLSRMAEADQLAVTYQPDYGETVDFADVEAALSSTDGARWDIVIVPNAQASRLVLADLAAPLPIEIIPNHRNLDPAFMTNAWDRGSRFQMPWQAGITGIAYNREAVGGDVTSVSALFDPTYRGRVGFITEMREAVGMAMLANGDDPSRPTAVTAEAGLATISDAVASGQVGTFGDVDMIDLLEGGQVDLAMAWSGDASRLPSDRFGFVVPDDGAMQWFDTMVIAKNSGALGAAGAFMNYVYDPANAAVITSWVQYICPVQGTQDVLAASSSTEDRALADNELVFPTAATRSRLYTWGVLDRSVEDDIEARFNQLIDAL